MVISVSLGTGCYRHLKISDQAKLEELNDEILDAFEFINDHASAFLMNNRRGRRRLLLCRACRRRQ